MDTLKFSIYRDDGFDIVRNGPRDMDAYKEHLNNLHPNLTFDVRHGKEGEHLDLWLMMRDKIEWKCYMKTPPVYVGPTSCHDPVVKKAVFKGVGHRLRINTSRVEYFDEAVDTCSKSFAIAGYDYQHARSELRKFRNDDPVEMIKAGPKEKNNDETGVKIFYVDKFDPRMPHPRKMIARNYHHIENHPIVSKLFPRKNLIASCKRLPNLGEILSPTIQNTKPGGNAVEPAGVGPGGGGDNAAVRTNGSFYCDKYSRGGSCDACKHMQRETRQVESFYFLKTFAIHGSLVHLKPSQKPKLKWFIYLIEDLGCRKQYVGSTTDVCGRWAATKSACNKANSNSTGLYKHFQEGCPSDSGLDKDNLRLTLLDFLDTTVELLDRAGHVAGPQCRCKECNKLKRVEDKWILRLGTFHGDSGLNSRDEIVNAVRGNFKL